MSTMSDCLDERSGDVSSARSSGGVKETKRCNVCLITNLLFRRVCETKIRLQDHISPLLPLFPSFDASPTYFTPLSSLKYFYFLCTAW